MKKKNKKVTRNNYKETKEDMKKRKEKFFSKEETEKREKRKKKATLFAKVGLWLGLFSIIVGLICGITNGTLESILQGLTGICWVTALICIIISVRTTSADDKELWEIQKSDGFYDNIDTREEGYFGKYH